MIAEHFDFIVGTIVRCAQKCFSVLWTGHAQAAGFQDIAHLSILHCHLVFRAQLTVGIKRQQRQMATIFTCDMLGVPYKLFEIK